MNVIVEEKGESPVLVDDSIKSRTTGSEGQPAGCGCSHCVRDRKGFDYANLDAGIVLAVRVLRDAGVDTIWSCEGGQGHTFIAPTVAFRGDAAEARRVVEVARRAHMAPIKIARYWRLWRGGFDQDERPTLDRINAEGLEGEWQIEFAAKFRHGAVIPPKKAVPSRRNEVEQEQEQLFQLLAHREPALRRLWERVMADVIGLDDVWLTYFSYLLRPMIGPDRQDDGNALLFSKEAFDAALFTLHRHKGEIYNLQQHG